MWLDTPIRSCVGGKPKEANLYVVLKASSSGIALHPLAAGQTRKISLLSHFIDEELAECLAWPLEGRGYGGERGRDGASDGFNVFHPLPSVLDTLHTACTRSSLGIALPLLPLGTSMAARPSCRPGLPGCQAHLCAHSSPTAGPGSDPTRSCCPAPRGRQWLRKFMKGEGNGKSTIPRGRALPGSAAPRGVPSLRHPPLWFRCWGSSGEKQRPVHAHACLLHEQPD